LTIATSGKPRADAEKLVDDSIKAGRLVKVEERFTTGKMLAGEVRILELERSGRGTVARIKSPDEVEAMLAKSNLNQGQKDAAALILTSPNRFVGIQGYAGTGKSHMLSKAVDAIKAEAAREASNQGYEVIGLAPYASQNKALAELGMKSQTLASFLLRKEDQAKLGSKTIVFLDEASVVPVHQMRDLMEKVEKAGARLVLIGDKKQTQAVEAGKPFEQLQDKGIAIAHITEIQRQKTPELKAAVISAANGKIEAATSKLGPRTIEVPAAPKRHQHIAQQYASLPEQERNATLIVAGTNEARQSINALVRAELGLKGDGPVQTLDSIDMTRAEKSLAGSYSPGQVIIFEGGKGGGLERGTHYDVLDVDAKANKLTVSIPGGKPIMIDPDAMSNLSAYKKQEIPLAQGDWVRMTRNNPALDVANGNRHRVEKITADTVILSGGIQLPRSERLHMQYGYATTVHSAQGLTSNRVIIDADSKSLTSNRAVFYVAISRPRHDLTIFTDDKSKLAEVMSREPKKYAALELRGEVLEKQMFDLALQRQALLKTMPTDAPLDQQSTTADPSQRYLPRKRTFNQRQYAVPEAGISDTSISRRTGEQQSAPNSPLQKAARRPPIQREQAPPGRAGRISAKPKKRR
jgi:ATP-dependent exoDNAse (exonuclease V) alpha subunit